MAKIVISRSSEYSNKFRSIGIYLDGNKIGEIKDGKTQAFDVTPGVHTLKCKIDWCTSNEVELSVLGDEIVTFHLSGRNPFLAIYYVTFGSKDYLVLKQV